VVLPGGFSYGDYLRAGAIARFAPVMTALIPAAQGGLPVLGICNGFQILCESHLLPGAMIQNDHRTFICRDQRLRVENATTAWTSDFAADDEITIVLKNQDGQYVADQHTLDELEGEGRVAFRYVIEQSVVDGPQAPAAAKYDRFDGRNPNGSYRDIAGVTNERGNVVGLMPHPEHAIEEGYGPSLDGLKFFTSVLKSVVNS
jgi:phosphoribosylformylglycinamidine synthase